MLYIPVELTLNIRQCGITPKVSRSRATQITPGISACITERKKNVFARSHHEGLRDS